MSSNIVGIGLACIDHLSIVSHTNDGWETCSTPLVQGGGLIATAACAAARLGTSCDLWSLAGDDLHGQMVRQELAAYGVGVDHVQMVPGMRTPASFIEVDALTGERTIFFSPGCGPIPEEIPDFDPTCVRGARSLLVSSRWLQSAIAGAREARKWGAVVVADISCLLGPASALVPFVDALIVPEDTGIAVAGGRDFPLAVRRMVEMGPRTPAVTVGAEGCWYWADGAVYHCPAFPVRAVDTTGCGDSFHGAFAYAIACGWDVHRSIRFSSAVAALVATKLGGRSGLPTLAEVERFLADRTDQGVARRVQ